MCLLSIPLLKYIGSLSAFLLANLSESQWRFILQVLLHMNTITIFAEDMDYNKAIIISM